MEGFQQGYFRRAIIAVMCKYETGLGLDCFSKKVGGGDPNILEQIFVNEAD
jgi:hypothetical protein